MVEISQNFGVFSEYINFTSAFDEEGFQSMDVSGVSKLALKQFKKECKSYVCNQFVRAEEASFDNKSDEKFMRKHPEFDPVFMKV